MFEVDIHALLVDAAADADAFAAALRLRDGSGREIRSEVDPL